MKELINYYLLLRTDCKCRIWWICYEVSISHWLGNSLGTTLSNTLMQLQWVLRRPRFFPCPSERKRNLTLLGSKDCLGLQLKKLSCPQFWYMDSSMTTARLDFQRNRPASQHSLRHLRRLIGGVAKEEITKWTNEQIMAFFLTMWT